MGVGRVGLQECDEGSSSHGVDVLPLSKAGTHVNNTQPSLLAAAATTHQTSPARSDAVGSSASC